MNPVLEACVADADAEGSAAVITLNIPAGELVHLGRAIKPLHGDRPERSHPDVPFGQLQGVIIPSATALLSTAWAMGFMGHVGIPMNPWTAAVPLMVVTVAAGHSAQMLKRYYEEFVRLGRREEAVIESTSRIGVVMIAAGVTAGSGFAHSTAIPRSCASCRRRNSPV